jgi:hypothetical protein
MRPRFQADADFNQKIVLGLRRREPAIDFEDLLLIWAATEAAEWVDNIAFLPL